MDKKFIAYPIKNLPVHHSNNFHPSNPSQKQTISDDELWVMIQKSLIDILPDPLKKAFTSLKDLYLLDGLKPEEFLDYYANIFKNRGAVID